MIKLDEFVNEKLRVSTNNVTPDIPLGERGWGCISINSMYNEIYQADDFLKADIDLIRLSSIDTNDYTTDRVIFTDKVFLALKRRKWCKKIINVILSEYTFDEGVEKVQEILNNNAECISGDYNTPKYYVIRIFDSHKTPALVLKFTKI